jgi:hypothetical protein
MVLVPVSFDAFYDKYPSDNEIIRKIVVPDLRYL